MCKLIWRKYLSEQYKAGCGGEPDTLSKLPFLLMNLFTIILKEGGIRFFDYVIISLQ